VKGEFMIQNLVMLYELYGKEHEINAGKLGAEYQKRDKPLAGTRGPKKYLG
jgi:hypothetical protein